MLDGPDQSRYHPHDQVAGTVAELAHFLDELGARYTPGESPLCWQCLEE